MGLKKFVLVGFGNNFYKFVFTSLPKKMVQNYLTDVHFGKNLNKFVFGGLTEKNIKN